MSELQSGTLAAAQPEADEGRTLVELSLPDSLRNTLTDTALGGSVAVGQQFTLSFALPKNWSDQARRGPSADSAARPAFVASQPFLVGQTHPMAD